MNKKENDYNQKHEYDSKKHKDAKIEKVYAYQDENEKLAYEKERLEGKIFRFRQPNPDNKDKPIYNLKGITPLPYLLPKWKENDEVLIAEGEKDADTLTLATAGIPVTSTPFGVHNFPEEIISWFKDKKVHICYDVGAESDAKMVADKLLDVAKEVSIINLPSTEKDYDLSDYLAENSERLGEAIAELYSKYATRYEDDVDVQFNPALEETLIDDKIEVRNSFLRRYVEIHSEITDAPQHFILFSGLALLSAVLNHFHFIWPGKTFLNLYILLLAQSTTERKSTLIDFVYDYVKEAGSIASEPTKLIFPSTFSLEAFFDILEERNRGIILWRELNTVKSLFSKEYGKALPSMFTNIWDGRPVSQQFKNAGFRKVDNPVVSILCGGIGEWLVEGLQKKDFQGGIWTRFIFVPAAARKKSYHLPGLFVRNIEILQELNHLVPLVAEEMNLNAVKTIFEYWMQQLTEEKQTLGNAIAETFYSKLEINVLKIACLLQLATNQSSVVEEGAMWDAINIGEWLKRQLPNLLRDFLESEWDRERARILYVLERKDKSLTKEIYQFANVSAERGIKHLEYLMNEGLVDVEETRKIGKRGRPGRRFFLAK